MIGRLLVWLLAMVLLVGCGAGCGGDKGKGTNAGRDKPTRPEK